jgi:hypothetical protein
MFTRRLALITGKIGLVEAQLPRGFFDDQILLAIAGGIFDLVLNAIGRLLLAGRILVFIGSARAGGGSAGSATGMLPDPLPEPEAPPDCPEPLVAPVSPVPPLA